MRHCARPIGRYRVWQQVHQHSRVQQFRESAEFRKLIAKLVVTESAEWHSPD
jgi:hypothetical protein